MVFHLRQKSLLQTRVKKKFSKPFEYDMALVSGVSNVLSFNVNKYFLGKILFPSKEENKKQNKTKEKQ